MPERPKSPVLWKEKQEPETAPIPLSRQVHLSLFISLQTHTYSFFFISLSLKLKIAVEDDLQTVELGFEGNLIEGEEVRVTGGWITTEPHNCRYSSFFFFIFFFLFVFVHPIYYFHEKLASNGVW